MEKKTSMRRCTMCMYKCLYFQHTRICTCVCILPYMYTYHMHGIIMYMCIFVCIIYILIAEIVSIQYVMYIPSKVYIPGRGQRLFDVVW